jgi:UDP-2-acetamido-2,6-beta-L-arabino-hexul-4-ose reductase
MRIVITGADGFIGTNLRMRLEEMGQADVDCITVVTAPDAMQAALAQADFVFHLAGVNRTQYPAEFASGNAGMTQDVCAALDAAGRRATVVLSSSTQAAFDNPYGRSKRAAEDAVRRYAAATGAAVHVFRLPNVFGKWARPNYNSAVATFCHNIARGLPITVNDPATPLQLVYVDDVVDCFVQLMDDSLPHCEEERHGNPGGTDCRATLAMTGGEQSFDTVATQYTTTVGELARQIQTFKDSRTTLMTECVGSGLVRALYATYVSYLPVEAFSYTLTQHADPRGVFVEVMKTPNCGQYSYFTAYPGITRGGHYHHSKTEKFLVIKGTARFKFRHTQSGQTHELVTSGEKPEIVETVPGWTHDITNIGADEVIVMLWANEFFDRERPDTFTCAV